MRSKITALVATVVAAAGTASAVKWVRERKGEDALDPEISETRSPSSEEADVSAAPSPDAVSAPAAAPAQAPVPEAVDDLTAIKGLGPARAAKLIAAGVTSYAQIAAWTDEDIAAMGLACDTSPGQIKRADWVGQAKTLSEG